VEFNVRFMALISGKENATSKNVIEIQRSGEELGNGFKI